MAAMSVPGRLPNPPRTQIAKTRPMYSRPIEGSTGWITIKNAPAMAAVAIEMPKAIRLIRVGSAAISLSANWSCATAIIARPVNVRDKKSCKLASRSSDIRQGISMRIGRSTTPKWIVWSM
jgi:hypothetical protein